MVDSIANIQQKLAQIQPYLRTKYRVKQLYLFGSYARKEASDSSDIDLLVDFTEIPDLLDFIELESYLSEYLGKPVDLVLKRKLHQRLRKQILEEVIAV